MSVRVSFLLLARASGTGAAVAGVFGAVRDSVRRNVPFAVAGSAALVVCGGASLVGGGVVLAVADVACLVGVALVRGLGLGIGQSLGDERVDVDVLLLGHCFDDHALFGEFAVDRFDLVARALDSLAHVLDLLDDLVQSFVEFLRDVRDAADLLGGVAEWHVPGFGVPRCRLFDSAVGSHGRFVSGVGPETTVVKTAASADTAMKQTRLAPLVGVVGCVLVLVSLAVPYGLVRTAPASAVGTYYGEGVLNPLVGGIFALVTAIVLAAGRDERTDPPLAAGVGIALGGFTFVVTALWAATVPQQVVFDMDAPAIITYHRWASAAVALVIPTASLWWSRTLGLL